jgi:transposase
VDTPAQVKRRRRPIDAKLAARMIKLYAGGLSIRAVAETVDRSYGAVRRVLVLGEIAGEVKIRQRGPARIE